MKKFTYLKIVALIFISTFISCSTNVVRQHSQNNPQIEQARKDSLINAISGMYSGKTPCADCEGINYTIVLYPSMSFTTKSVYIGKDIKPFESKGKWMTIGDSIIVLKSTTGATSYLQLVSNDSMFMLDDSSMKKIKGPLESMFVLKRSGVKADTSNSFDSGIQDSNYILEMLNDKKVSNNDYTNEIPQLRFNTKEGTVSGSSGCNRLNGEVKISGNEISFSNLAMTRMMCPGDGEANFLSALKNAETFKAENNKLYLMDDTRTVAVFRKEI